MHGTAVHTADILLHRDFGNVIVNEPHKFMNGKFASQLSECGVQYVLTVVPESLKFVRQTTEIGCFYNNTSEFRFHSQQKSRG